MWHEHGEGDLNWLPEMQAERAECATRLGQAAMYLTSVQALCYEEFEQTGFISDESKQMLSEAHRAHHDTIAWLAAVNSRIHDEETK